MTDHLTALDAAFLELEESDASAHMHVGIAVVSYDGEVVFGLNADRDTVPDLEVLKRGIVASLAELQELAGSRWGMPKRSDGACGVS